MDTNKEYILKMAREKNIKFIKLWFTDILGILKSFTINIEELDDALHEGVRFDGAVLGGFHRDEEREMIAMPDITTFQVLPWRPSEDCVARMFCDIYTSDMKPYESDSRYILKKNLKEAADLGLTFYTGPEIEFFFFKSNDTPELLDKGGYFDLTPLDLAADFRRQTVLTLEKMGMAVISSHHEGAYSQHEIDLRHEDAMTTADNIMTFRVVAKEVAQDNNIYASFMPKPLSGSNGSGLHIHMSLFNENEENSFYNPDGQYKLSDTAKHFIAGILTHIKEFTAVTNQWVNSYKRFAYGFEAPAHISWSTNITTSLIRIPEVRADKGHSMRVELRNPDPSCNPYLTFSCILAAGLEGIKNKYELSSSLEEKKQPTSLEEIESRGYEMLPTHLAESLIYFQNSPLMKKTLGEAVVDQYVKNKLTELKSFNSFVTDYEINKYYPLL